MEPTHDRHINICNFIAFFFDEFSPDTDGNVGVMNAIFSLLLTLRI